MINKKNILVAMSGGVDSSVTAFLLQQQGWNVSAVTFNLYQTSNPQHIKDAKKVSSILNIPHYIMDLEDIFQEKIINYFINSYTQGNTPNPCSFCNRLIKFAALESKAKELNINYFATGHYATLIETPNGKRLSVGKDIKKSQEYFLALIPKTTLERIVFPLSQLEKPQVREIARENSLEFVGNKPDSQEVCFLKNKPYTQFLEEKSPISLPQKGIIRSKTGAILGYHKGFFRYTKGQRRGIGIGVGKPQYVVETNALSNEIIIGNKEDVYNDVLHIKLINIFDTLHQNQDCKVKIRYKSPSQNCKIIEYKNSTILLKAEGGTQLQGSFFAASKGQIAVIYNSDDIVIAAGEITDNY